MAGSSDGGSSQHNMDAMKDVIKSVWAIAICIFLFGGFVFSIPGIYSGLKTTAERAAEGKFGALRSENQQLKDQLAQHNDKNYSFERRAIDAEEKYEAMKQIAIQTDAALQAKEAEHQELYDAFRAQTDSFNLMKDSVSTLLATNQTQSDLIAQLTQDNASYSNQLQQLTAERNAEKALVAQAQHYKTQAGLFGNTLLAIPISFILWVVVVRYRRNKEPNTFNLDPNYSRRNKSVAA